MIKNPYFPDVLLWAIPFFVLGIALELLALKRRPVENAYTRKDAITSVLMGLGSSVTDTVFKFIPFGLLIFVWQFRVIDLGMSIPIIMLALVLDDFSYYWRHWLSHKSRWCWAVHVVHHSSEHFNLTTALRQPWTSSISGTFILQIPLVLMGFHPFLLAFVYMINLLYQFWFHTETITKMPYWFEYIFNTPSHHRVHHARNPRYLDANFAGIFMIWDRIFGTFVPELDDEKPDYGIVHQLNSHNIFRVSFHEFIGIFKDVFQKGPSIGQRILYIFAAPGYSHDKSRKTANDLKRDFLEKHPEQSGSPGLPKNL
ncbi:MAG: C-5 sterol desaturase [Robiginitomaculum sp.]|nr:MAG: C-5 sterol desaturase [Robiginitomaculum sp.]